MNVWPTLPDRPRSKEQPTKTNQIYYYYVYHFYHNYIYMIYNNVLKEYPYFHEPGKERQRLWPRKYFEPRFRFVFFYFIFTTTIIWWSSLCCVSLYSISLFYNTEGENNNEKVYNIMFFKYKILLILIFSVLYSRYIYKRPATRYSSS